MALDTETLDPDEVQDPASGLALVPVSGALTTDQRRELEAQLAAWGHDGDVDSLNDARAMTEAAQMYAKRNGLKEIANQYARLQIHAEANIGRIDRRLNPALPKRAPWLELGVAHVEPGVRIRFRTLAIVAERNLLTGLLDDLDNFAWCNVQKEISRRGLLWASTRPLREHIASRGLNYATVAQTCSKTRVTVRNALTQERIQWSTAVWIAEAVALDPLSLPPEPSTHKSGVAERRRRRREAEAALARERQRKAIKQALRSAGKAQHEAYAMAERFQDVIAQAQREATVPEAIDAWRRAGTLAREMRDETVRALGVT